jgi:hypothetical protein
MERWEIERRRDAKVDFTSASLLFFTFLPLRSPLENSLADSVSHSLVGLWHGSKPRERRERERD